MEYYGDGYVSTDKFKYQKGVTLSTGPQFCFVPLQLALSKTKFM